MNWFFSLIIVCVVLAVVRLMAIALGIGLLIFLLFCAIRYPRELCLYGLILGLFGLMNAQPLACIVAIGVIGVAVVIADAKRKSPGRPPRLTDAREHHSN
jgi:hypothetical protein